MDDEEVGVRLTINGQEVFVSKAKGASDAIDNISKSTKRANDSSKGLGSGLGDLAGKLNILGTAGKFAQYYIGYQLVGGLENAASSAISFGVKAAGSFEQTNIAMKTMLGSQQAATDFINQLQTFAQNTPFNFSGLVQTSERMMALGFQTKEILPDLTAIGNAASALGTGQDGIDRIVLALGQMRSSAHLNAQDMMQLTNANINAWQYLATAAHKSIAQVRKDAEAGVIDPQQASNVILQGMANDPRFKGMMDAQSKTLFGMWSNLQDKVQAEARKSFAPFNEMLKSEIPGATTVAYKAVDWLGARMTDMLGGVQQLNTAFKQGGVDGVLDKVGQWTGTGSLFKTLWHSISTDSKDIGLIFKNSVLPGVRDVATALGPEFIATLTTINTIFGWMAAHPDFARVVFDGIAFSIIGFKTYSLVEGITGSILGLENELKTAGTAALTFGGNMETGLNKAITAAGGTAVAVQGAKQGGFAGLLEAAGGGALGGSGFGPLGALGGAVLGVGGWDVTQLMKRANSSGSSSSTPKSTFSGPLGPGEKPPGMATGGTVTTGGWSWVGEQGPELLHLNAGAQVVPLNKMPNAQSGSVVFEDGAIRVSGTDVLNAQATADIIVDRIKDKLARA